MLSIKIIILFFIYFMFSGFCILGSFDIGACLLLPFITRNDIDKRIVINSIAFNWDGNQVWLITLIGLIFSAWPIVYSIILNSLYLYINIMLFFLVIRSISIDFRSKINKKNWKNIFDILIFVSNLFIIFIIGLIIGILIQGIPFYINKYFYIKIINNVKINLFSFFMGLLFTINSIVHGSIYLQIRTKNFLCYKANKICKTFILFQLINIMIIILIMFYLIEGYSYINNIINSNQLINNKFILKDIGIWKYKYYKNPYLFIFIILYIISPIFTYISNIYKKNIISLIFSSFNIILLITIISITMFPFVIPSSYDSNISLTVWNSTSSENILKIICLFIIIFLPIILSYTIFSYKKMSGKIDNKFIKKNKNILY